MKLIETIERCEKLVLEEIDGCKHYLVWYESSISDTEESRKEVQKINERKNELLEDLNNLRFIKDETGLEPIALKDREPQLTDLDDEECCWWWCEVHECWERFTGDMGGIASIREGNKMNDYPHQYTHWLPYWVIKQPLEKNETN